MTLPKILLLVIVAILCTACTLANRPKTSLETENSNLPEQDTVDFAIQQYRLAQQSDRYPHAALGDNLEPTVVLRTTEVGSEETLIALDKEQVFETNRVLVRDITGDETPELLLTVSHQELGAANVVYDLDGKEVARTDYIGTRFRWRHLLGVMENGVGQKFLVDVVTPHLAGVLTLYKLEEDRLVPVFEEAGYPSHEFGSTDLEQATISRKDGRDILRIPHEDGFEHFLYIEGERFVLLDK